MSESKTVFCSRYKKEMAALEKAPLKGIIGEQVLNNVSKKAWDEWLEFEIKLINEERLDLSEESAQQRLATQMMSFLNIKFD